MSKKVKTMFGQVTVGKMKGQNRYRIVSSFKGKKKQFTASSIDECVHKYEQFCTIHVLDSNHLRQGSTVIFPSQNTTSMSNLEEYLDEWLKRKINIRRTTRARYEGTIKNHINPSLGNLPLNKITHQDIEELYHNTLQGLSVSSVVKIHDILNSALSKASAQGIIHSNPMQSVERPRYTAPEMNFYDKEQVDILLTTAKEHFPEIASLVTVAVTTGMREGELLGLQWKDIDFSTGKLHIRRACSDVNGIQEIGSLKTKSSRRSIMMMKITIEAFQSQLQQAKEKGFPIEHNNLVFPNTQGGKPMRVRWLTGKWKCLLEKAELPYIRIHDLRHTHATILAHSGIPVKVIQARLGHSTIATTMDRYAHFCPSSEEHYISNLNYALNS